MASDCAYFLQPPVLNSPDHNATVVHACGALATKLRSEGYSEYATQAKAQAAVNTFNHKVPVLSADASNAPGDAARAALDATGLGGVTPFLEHLSDGRMWASIGWVALGLILILLGVNEWLKKTGSGGIGMGDVAALAAA